MVALVSLPVDQIVKPGWIDGGDVLKLKTKFYDCGFLSDEEAETLFGLCEPDGGETPVWADFFIDALSDYFVNQLEPEGYVTADGAAGLIERIASQGRIDHKIDFDLLIRVIDTARWTPASLVRLALEQIKFAVADGDGPLRSGQSLERGRISSAEVEIVRHILCAFGGRDQVALTRAEVEVLFDINDAIADWSVNPAWTDLFLKAVTNAVMAASGQAVPARDVALRRDEWVERRGECAARTLLFGLVASSLGAIEDSYIEQSPEAQALARLEHQRIEIITGEKISGVDADWLSERIGRSKDVNADELALVTHLESLSQRMHPDLRAAIDRLGKAA